MFEFGDYVVYVDEAGDHGPISKEFPVFVLAFCVFRKRDYGELVLPAVHALKFRYFGHDAVVLHEREIRKQLPPFEFLRDAAVRPRFMSELSGLIEGAPFTLIAVVVDKRNPPIDRPAQNPYRVALDVGLVHVTRFLRDRGEQRLTHVVAESRGKNEDADLRSAFDSFCSPAGSLSGCNLDLVFAAKAHNHNGMQLADMVARPIGRHLLDPPAQVNRAYDVLARKFWNAAAPIGTGLHLLPGESPGPA